MGPYSENILKEYCVDIGYIDYALMECNVFSLPSSSLPVTRVTGLMRNGLEVSLLLILVQAEPTSSTILSA